VNSSRPFTLFERKKLSNTIFGTELGRRALLDAMQRAKTREMQAIMARNTAVSDQRIQHGGKGTSTLIDLDERVLFATRDRLLCEDLTRKCATARIAPDPKDTETLQLGHRVMCECIDTKKGTDVPEQFMFRMGGYGEDVPDDIVPVCDYTKPAYRHMLGSEVSDEITFPGKGKAVIVEILPPFDPIVAQAKKAA
jgi:hypothetical protein